MISEFARFPWRRHQHEAANRQAWYTIQGIDHGKARDGMGDDGIHGTLLGNKLFNDFTVVGDGKKSPLRKAVSRGIECIDCRILFQQGVYVVLPSEGMTLPPMKKQDLARAVAPLVALQADTLMHEMKSFRRAEKVMLVWF